jgi:hypothetical protein
MDKLYEWIKIVLAYKIIASLLLELVCGEKNKKMIRFFSGLILIFLVIRPITSFVGMDEQLENFFTGSIALEEIREWDLFMDEADEKRRQELLSAYTEPIREKITEFVEEEGLVADDIQVQYDTDDASGIRIEAIIVRVSRKYERSEAVKNAYDATYGHTASIEEIHIKAAISSFYKLESDHIIYEEQ